MKCPKCDNDNTSIIKESPMDGEVMRERRCVCGVEFDTIERTLLNDRIKDFKAQMRRITR